MTPADWMTDDSYRTRLMKTRTDQHRAIFLYLVRAGCNRDVAGLMSIRFMQSFVPHATSKSESPIEALFMVGLARHTIQHQRIEMAPQVNVGRYRVDVRIGHFFADHGSHLYVELDGHDYHERTKEQAEKDRTRDRWFSMQGLRVIRFTGREVWRDPGGCATAAIEDYLADVDRRGFTDDDEVPF